MPLTAIYGLLAEFDSSTALVEACRKTREAGYTHIEAYSPYPLPEAARAIGLKRYPMSFVVFLGGLVGGCAGFFMQWWINTTAYPLDIGGKPPNSWPMFIPVTFELTILTAATSGFLGVFVMSRLPRFSHPLFATPLFARATSDGFYLCIEASDPRFEPTATQAFLQSLKATGIEEVPQ